MDKFIRSLPGKNQLVTVFLYWNLPLTQTEDGRSTRQNWFADMRGEHMTPPAHRGSLQPTSAPPNVLGHSEGMLQDLTLTGRPSAAPDGEFTSDTQMARVARGSSVMRERGTCSTVRVNKRSSPLKVTILQGKPRSTQKSDSHNYFTPLQRILWQMLLKILK